MTSPDHPRPTAKRIKLEDRTPRISDSQAEPVENDSDMANLEPTEGEEDCENNCIICLHSVVDRTVIPNCSHDFCFECLVVWTEQSRRCPLCSRDIGEYIIHSIRSRYDYRKHHLPPLRTSPLPSRPSQSGTSTQNERQNTRRVRRDREWGRGTRTNESEEFDKLERSITKRRWIYQHDLYAKHVASNSYTKYRPYPTPTQFSASQELISRTTTFLRRELQVWEGLDVEFLASLILSLMKAIDIRSESAVKLISEFLDMDEPYTAGRRHVNAEHFAHEVYCYVRSPYRDLFVYDSVAQYDMLSGIPPPREIERSRRWRTPSPLRAVLQPSSPPQDDGRRRPRSISRSSERSASWSPGRQHHSSRNQDGGNNNVSVRNFLGRDNSHHHRSNIPQNEILLDSEKNPRGDKPEVSSSSSSKFARDRPMSIDHQKSSGKGKRKAFEIEPTDVLADPPSGSEAAGTITDVGRSGFELTPGKAYLQSDQTHGVGVQPISSHPSKFQRAPRHKSLFDSVKAHLSGNVAVLKDVKNEHQEPQEPIVSSEYQKEAIIEDTDCQNVSWRKSSKNNSSRSRERSTGSIVDGFQSSSSAADGVRRATLSGKERATSGGSLTEIPRPEISSSPANAEEDALICSRNNTLSKTTSTVIIDPGPPSSSSNGNAVHGQSYAAGTMSSNPTNGLVPAKMFSDRNQKHDGDFTLIQTGAASGSPNCETQILSDVQVRNTLPRAITDFPFEDASQSTSVGVNQLPTLNSNQIRTRLLARLALEKNQALSLDPTKIDINPGTDASQDSPNPSSSSPSHHESLDAGHLSRPFDGEKGSSVSLKPQGYVQADPDSPSDIVAEAARVREGKLRARARLRVRLAAEKRRGDDYYTVNE